MKYFRMWWNSIRRQYYEWLISKNLHYKEKILILYKKAVTKADKIRRRQVAKFEKRHERYNTKLKKISDE